MTQRGEKIFERRGLGGSREGKRQATDCTDGTDLRKSREEGTEGRLREKQVGGRVQSGEAGCSKRGEEEHQDRKADPGGTGKVRECWGFHVAGAPVRGGLVELG